MEINTFLRADELATNTAEAFDNPIPGDMFEEFLSVWVSVVSRDGDTITWRVQFGHPTKEQVRTGTISEFKATYAYTSKPGYSVKLFRRGNPV